MFNSEVGIVMERSLKMYQSQFQWYLWTSQAQIKTLADAADVHLIRKSATNY